MKRSLLALAVLGAFAGAASAQSSVTLYGRVDLAAGTGSLAALPDLLHDDELVALAGRVAALLEEAVMPLPSGVWPAIPWPAF